VAHSNYNKCSTVEKLIIEEKRGSVEMMRINFSTDEGSLKRRTGKLNLVEIIKVKKVGTMLDWGRTENKNIRARRNES
jgi:hypothetical protein